MSDYPSLTLDHIEQKHLEHLRQPDSPLKPMSPIPPIIVHATDASFRLSQEMHSGSRIRIELPFAIGSREWNELVAACVRDDTTEHSTELSSAFHKRYPVLAALTSEVTQEETCTDVLRKDVLRNHTNPHTKDNHPWVVAVSALYREFAQPTAEVYFHQCFQHENLWGANSRDRKFMTEMDGMLASMEDTARTLCDTRCERLQNMLTITKWTEVQDRLVDELVSVFKQSRTIICGYRTRNKASETLDKKYEVHCLELMARHGVFVQLFNLKSLMYDVTAHEIVPIHHQLDRWHHGEEIARVQRVNHIRDLSKELSVIPLNDPVAKMVGLRRGQVCRIVRVNDTGGTGVAYRWCK